MLKLKNLQNVLLNDRHIATKSVEEILKSEVFKTLLNYLEIKPENMSARFDVDKNGDFEFCLKISAKRLKIMGILPKEV